MSNHSLPCPPVLVLAFNRPETTKRVLEALRLVRPLQVFFAVDGPRPGKSGEVEAVSSVRTLAETMDWGCEVRTLFRERNLGCKLAVSEAISWFFSSVEEGIVLEDDCVAHPTFFPYAAELLQRYRYDERVMLVSGNNFQYGRRRSPYSYYFSRYNHIWGWASWRRAWNLYDHGMKAWPEIRDGGWMMDLLGSRRAAEYWTRIFDATHAEQNTSWAYRWTFACWANGGLSTLPNVNLVTNIGFGTAATHTVERESALAGIPHETMEFPLRHPSFVIRDAASDDRTEQTLFSGPFSVRRSLGQLVRTLKAS